MNRRKPTLAIEIQRRILDDIQSGVYLPGAALEEVELASQYSVSRTPVREALRQLSALGMVKIRPRLGAVVVDHSTENRKRETLEVIAELEGAAARYASQRISLEERRSLVALRDQMQRCVDSDDRAGFDELNLRFHKSIHQAARNTLLLESIAQMRMRILPYTRANNISEHARPATSLAEHVSLINAILHGNPELAYHAMRFHVISADSQDEDIPSN